MREISCRFESCSPYSSHTDVKRVGCSYSAYRVISHFHPEEVAGNPLQNALMLYKLANRSSKPKETERYRLGVLSAEIAQWIEHFATDEVVVGSSPTFGIFHNIKHRGLGTRW